LAWSSAADVREALADILKERQLRMAAVSQQPEVRGHRVSAAAQQCHGSRSESKCAAQRSEFWRFSGAKHAPRIAPPVPLSWRELWRGGSGNASVVKDSHNKHENNQQ
jgi:hypothetical protein